MVGCGLSGVCMLLVSYNIVATISKYSFDKSHENNVSNVEYYNDQIYYRML